MGAGSITKLTARHWDRLLQRNSPAADAALQTELHGVATADPDALVSAVPRLSRELVEYLLLNEEVLPPALHRDVTVAAATKAVDTDAKDLALEILRDRYPDAARKLLPAIRRRIRSNDFFAPVTALWTVLKLRDVGAIVDVRAAVARFGSDDGRGRIAAIVLHGLEGDDEWIARRLLGHEHFETAWLAHAARVVGTEGLLRAIREAAATLPDEECREQCRSELSSA